MSTQQHTAEYEDVSIDSNEGLDVLWQNIRQVYKFGLDTEEVARNSGKSPVELDRWNSVFDDLYNELRNVIKKARTSLESGGEVSDATIEKMQDLYNQFAELGEQVAQPEAMKTASPQPEVTQPKPAPPPKPRLQTTAEPAKQQPKATTKPDEKSGSKSKLRPKAIKPPPELQKAKKLVKNCLKQGRKIQEEITSVFKSKTPTTSEEMLIEELDASVERLYVLRKKVFAIRVSVENWPELKNQLETLVASCAEERKNVKAIAESLIAAKAKVEPKVLPEEVPIKEVVVSPPSLKKQKAMTIETSEEETVVPIIHKQPEAKVPTDDQLKPSINHAPLPKPENGAFKTRKFSGHLADPVKQVTYRPLTSDIAPANPIHETTSLTERYLQGPEYKNYILEHFSSLGAFEKLLDSIVTKIEANNIDPIEKWLGETFASPFDFLKDMTLEELDAFSKRSSLDIRADLKKENIKYEAYLEWIDLRSEMEELIPARSDMTYGELFAVFMIEREMLTRV